MPLKNVSLRQGLASNTSLGKAQGTGGGCSACPILSPSLRRLQLVEEAAEAQPDAAEMPPARCLPGHRAPPPVNQHRPGAGKHLLPIAFYYLPKFKKPATRQKLSPCEHHAMESLGSRLGWDGGEPKAVLG